MKNIAVIYGGRSPEHEVSILTGLHCANHISEDYHVTLIYFTRNNEFVLGSRKINDYTSPKHKWKKCYFTNGGLYKGNKKLRDITCVVNCCHGGAGEGGDLFSYFQIAGIPLTGCDYISSYTQQSKTATRESLTAAGFAQPKYQSITKEQYAEMRDELLTAAEFPLVVKPDLLGSSIGVSVVKNTDDLSRAIDVAFTMCDKVIVEEYIDFKKEVNIAVMRRRGKLLTSATEKVGGDNFLSFEEKYLNVDSGFIKKRGEPNEDDVTENVEIADLAMRAYELFNCDGVVRSDFLITDEGIYLNENNTVPGFLSYHLWLKNSIPYGVIIEDLINEAVTKFRANSELITDFPSNILEKNQKLVTNA